MIHLAVAGVRGRMGRAIAELLDGDARFELVAGLVSANDRGPTSIDVTGRRVAVSSHLGDAPCDVLIDVSLAPATLAWLEVGLSRRVPLVIGTTGHSQEALDRIATAARTIPIVLASNFSVGIQAILRRIGDLAKELGAGFDIEIVETHHRKKIDAPSGTAKAILDALLEVEPNTRRTVVYGREGAVGERKAGEIGMHAVRMGDIVGTHEVHFSGPGETLTIRHQAQSRATFAAGALRAAAWIVGRKQGLYSMLDVLRS